MNNATQPSAQQGFNLWSKRWNASKKAVSIEIGDLCLQATKLKHEWQISYHWLRKGNEGSFRCYQANDSSDTCEAEPSQTVAAATTAKPLINRIAMEAMTDSLTLQPRLADRSVVVRPYAPLIIPANNTITLYVSTPLWLCIHFSDEVCQEIPVQQLSDTWMGPVTREGVLCYGSHTHARLDQQTLLRLPYRVLTPVTMHNKGSEDSTLERLSIPCPYLAVYKGKDQLVTESLSIVMDSEKHQGIVKIEKADYGDAVSPARKIAARGILVHTWENLFA